MRACSAAARSSSLFPNSLRRRSTILDESQRPVGESTATTTRNRLRHYGLASRQTIEKIATARSPVTGTERGVSNREGDTSIYSRLSARNRFLLHCHPAPALTLGLWPPVGSNTETDDDC